MIPITPLSPLTDYSVLSSYHTAYPFHRLPSYSTSFVNYSFRVDYVPSSSSFHFFVLASSVIQSSSGHSRQGFFLFYSFRHMKGPGDTNNRMLVPYHPTISHTPYHLHTIIFHHRPFSFVAVLHLLLPFTVFVVVSFRFSGYSNLFRSLAPSHFFALLLLTSTNGSRRYRQWYNG